MDFRKIMHFEKDSFIKILDSMEDGAFIANAECQLQYISPALEKDFGAAEGKKCWFVPVGASNELGAMGYLNCAREISEWSGEQGVSFDRVYYAAGSGGTTAGLVMGNALYDLGAKVRGINVGEPREEFLKEIEAIIHRALQRFEVPVRFERENLEIIEGYYGKGYGDIPEKISDCIRRVALSDGLILDPVYTAKAMYGLIEEEKQIEGGRVLFIHTGGIFSLFAFRDRLNLKL